jgi:hypothetical protein
MSYNIAELCKLNSFDPRCDCINPPASVKHISNNMLSPYYCWYAPCLKSTTFKTQEIIQGQLHCQVKNCSITIDEIRVKGGNIKIENNCSNSFKVSEINSDANINLLPTKFEVKLPVYNYNLTMILFASVTLGLIVIS